MNQKMNFAPLVLRQKALASSAMQWRPGFPYGYTDSVLEWLTRCCVPWRLSDNGTELHFEGDSQWDARVGDWIVFDGDRFTAMSNSAFDIKYVIA